MNARISRALAAAAAVATLALPAAATAQGTFEGVVTFQVSAGPGGQQTMQYSVKGDKVRMDMSAGGMSMFTLYDGATKTVDMVMPMRQMYMERAIDNDQAMADSAAAKVKIEWTGQKETIAGRECEHANVTDGEGQTSDICLAKGMGPFMRMNGGMGGRGRGMRGGMGGGWEGHLGQAFPLKVTRNGQVEMLATKIEAKSLDDATFRVPDGYQKMQMPMGMPMGGRGRRGGGR
ncbi:MAG: DUF4412 domain-containing protein [Gemmatimonadota bacterium]|nr:DUF4412 domain-containing protein [Gemmatimonadota bacterium]HEU4988460.1 DUF4412 domain-containing protein [Gemmatimonadaceae bacterium]